MVRVGAPDEVGHHGSQVEIVAGDLALAVRSGAAIQESPHAVGDLLGRPGLIQGGPDRGQQ